MSEVDDSETSKINCPVYTKDEEYAGIVQDIDDEKGNIIIKGKLELRKYSIPRNMVVDSTINDNQVLLDMTQDDLTDYEI